MSSRPKVLCIEDDAATVELLVEVLEDEGFYPIVAFDGIEGVRKFGERPNVILCDVDMPHMSGRPPRVAKVGRPVAQYSVPVHHCVWQSRESFAGASVGMR